MKKGLGFSKLITLLMIGALLLSACTATNNNDSSKGSNSNGGSSDATKVLTYAMTKEPGTLDAGKSQDDLSNGILFHISEGLVRSYDSKIVPGIAETWDVSEDGLTYTFHLRDSVWSDGTPLTANDFEYSFKRFIDPNTGSAFVEKIYSIENAEAFNKGEITDASQVGIKAIDEHTLEIKLREPVPFFLTVLAANSYFYPVKQEIIEQYGDQYAADASKLLTNGPFKLEKWVHESELVMVKNENYWDKDNIKLDGITQLIIPDGNTQASMYDAGQLDYLAEITPVLVSKYKTAQSALAGGVQMLQFNVEGSSSETAKVMANQNFRKALSYAVDREAVAHAVAAVGSQAANRFVLPTTQGTNTTYQEEFPFEGVSINSESELANEYLDKALTELSMTKDQLPKLTYVAMEGKQKVYAEALQDTWDSVLGLKNIEITVLPTPQAIQATADRQYDIYVQSLDAAEDISTILSYWLANGSINWTGWNDQTYTDMYNDAMKEVDSNERYAKLFEVEKYLFENGPLEPFIYPGVSYVYHDHVIGVVKAPIGAPSQLIYADINK